MRINKVYKIIRKCYYSRSKIYTWYFRKNIHPHLENGKRFLSYDLTSDDNSITLTSVENMSNFICKDYHENESLKFNDFNLKYESEDSEIEKSNLSFENNSQSTHKNKIVKTGLLWLYNGNNKVEFLNDLFEFNNILPIRHKEKNTKFLYDFKIQEAPFNPIIHNGLTMDYNYFDLYSKPIDKDFFETLNFDHLNLFSKLIKESVEQFIENNKLDYVFVGGFSQGGCMAIYSFLKELKKLKNIKGIISINGFFIDNNFTFDNSNDVKFLNINGYNNDIITLGKSRTSFKKMQNIINKDKIETFEEFGLFHNMSQTSLQNVNIFIKNNTLKAFSSNNDS